MSRPAQPPGNDPKDSEGDLTDEQIRGLLKAAEQHLRACPTSSSSRRTQAMKPFKLQHTNIDKPYIQNVGHVARVDPSRMLDKSQRESAGRSLIPKGPTKLDKANTGAGPQWFNMPSTDPSFNKDIQLLKLRGVIDPKRHYKKQGPHSASEPSFAQMGTLIEGPDEYYSGRLPNKERRKNFIDGVLAQEAETGYFKRKYVEIQSRKTSGRKAHYKALQKRRAGHK